MGGGSFLEDYSRFWTRPNTNSFFSIMKRKLPAFFTPLDIFARYAKIVFFFLFYLFWLVEIEVGGGGVLLLEEVGC